ncbi:MAG: PipX family protein [Pseudanabaenaceae cyanobacterium bins.68]|nr:PipX family protein [Pseudanabaenaceae cyanobacterium bins.68]
MLEKYLNHPTFGLLTRICLVDDHSSLFTTLYAQRLFFLIKVTTPGGLAFETVSRNDAKLMIENRLRLLRRIGEGEEHHSLQTLYKRNFSH